MANTPDETREYEDDDLYWRGLTSILSKLSPLLSLEPKLKQLSSPSASLPKSANETRQLKRLRSFSNTLIRHSEIISIVPRITPNGIIGIMAVDIRGGGVTIPGFTHLLNVNATK